MPSFTSDSRFSRIDTDSSYKGWTVSTLGLGGWFGSLLNGYLCDLLSRRWTLFFGGIMCLLGTALTTGAQSPIYFVSYPPSASRSCASLVSCCALNVSSQVRWQVLHRVGSRRTLRRRPSLQLGDFECCCERYGRLYPTIGHRHRSLR
jgi:hypothetical protein